MFASPTRWQSLALGANGCVLIVFLPQTSERRLPGAPPPYGLDPNDVGLKRVLILTAWARSRADSDRRADPRQVSVGSNTLPNKATA
jgi:hypothetical protein